MNALEPRCLLVGVARINWLRESMNSLTKRVVVTVLILSTQTMAVASNSVENAIEFERRLRQEFPEWNDSQIQEVLSGVEGALDASPRVLSSEEREVLYEWTLEEVVSSLSRDILPPSQIAAYCEGYRLRVAQYASLSAQTPEQRSETQQQVERLSSYARELTQELVAGAFNDETLADTINISADEITQAWLANVDNPLVGWMKEPLTPEEEEAALRDMREASDFIKDKLERGGYSDHQLAHPDRLAATFAQRIFAPGDDAMVKKDTLEVSEELKELNRSARDEERQILKQRSATSAKDLAARMETARAKFAREITETQQPRTVKPIELLPQQLPTQVEPIAPPVFTPLQVAAPADPWSWAKVGLAVTLVVVALLILFAFGRKSSR